MTKQNAARTIGLPLARLAGLALVSAALASAPAFAQSKLAVPNANVSASSSDANVPANANDGSMSTRWSADATSSAQWLRYNLGSCQKVASLNLAWYNGDSRKYSFKLQTSLDGATWTDSFSGTNSGTSADLKPYDIPDVSARYVRVLGTGSTVNKWVSLKEMEVYSTGAGTCSSTPTNPHDANFSPATLQFLTANTGLNGEQWDNIMKLVNKPEQDSLDWVRAYSYCENINDGRGFTIGIVGATTGGSNDGGPDGPALFRIFDGLKGASAPSTLGGLKRIGITATMSGNIIKFSSSDTSGNMSSRLCTGIKALQNDAEWRAAMWQSAYDSYISVAVRNAKSRGYTSAATIGSFFDTALNQGGEGDANSLQGLIDQIGTASSEKAYMLKFHNKRLTVVNTNQYNQPPNGTRRVEQWMRLWDDGKESLIDADAEVVKVTSWSF